MSACTAAKAFLAENDGDKKLRLLFSAVSLSEHCGAQLEEQARRDEENQTFDLAACEMALAALDPLRTGDQALLKTRVQKSFDMLPVPAKTLRQELIQIFVEEGEIARQRQEIQLKAALSQLYSQLLAQYSDRFLPDDQNLAHIAFLLAKYTAEKNQFEEAAAML
ncbi:MAG TPA: hypothetical protein V6C72_08185, partial [Chroococcales cyanobacterium]